MYDHVDEKCSEYDIIYYDNDETVKHEVKYDAMSQRTRNMCIEFESNGKPSGVVGYNLRCFGAMHFWWVNSIKFQLL
jgi:hypothetical protein